LAAEYEFLGHKRLKNILRPLRVYRLFVHSSENRNRSRRLLSASPKSLAALMAVILGAGALAWWQPWAARFETASETRMSLALPDKPSIAVLPFANMSSAPDQDYLSDGISDDLITALSRVSGLFVIARNSTFVFKGRNVLPKQVSEELGVHYVLEGSVQKAGDRLRINAQLIDALRGVNAWADHFDGSVNDVFTLQDQVTRGVTDALAITLTDAEQQSIGRQETNVPEAYEEFLRGWVHIRHETPEDYRQSIPHLEAAIRLDPRYGRAYAALAWVYLDAFRREWTGSFGLSPYGARDQARSYLAQAEKHPTPFFSQVEAFELWIDGSLAAALQKYQEAIAADPGDALSYLYMGATLISLQRPVEAVRAIQTAMRIEPHYSPAFSYFLGIAELNLDQFAPAIEKLEDVTQRNPDDEVAFAVLGAAYALDGQIAKAKSAVSRCNELFVRRGGAPITLTTARHLRFGIGAGCRCGGTLGQDDMNRLQRGLQAAGVPTKLENGELGRSRLDEVQIRSLVVGHRMHGRSLFTGEERAASVSTEGVAELSGDWVAGGHIKGGGVAIESGELCYTFDVVRYCGAVLRNPGGTRALENEYIWDAGSPFTFSQID
jgi:TolB-like protein